MPKKQEGFGWALVDVPMPQFMEDIGAAGGDVSRERVHFRLAEQTTDVNEHGI